MRMERVIKERMTTQMDPATTTPAALINIRPVVASVREFFGGSQLYFPFVLALKRTSPGNATISFFGADDVERRCPCPVSFLKGFSDSHGGQSKFDSIPFSS